MLMRIAVTTLVVILSGCATTYRSDGLLKITERELLPYQHAAIVPKTDDSVKEIVAGVLARKGFTVYPATVYKEVQNIKPGNHVAVFVCRDAGRTDRGTDAYSQSVSCAAYDLHSGIVIYEGIGEFMGMTVVEDYWGAMQAALARLPNIDGSGRVTTVIDLPLRMDTRGSDDVLERNTAIDPAVTLLDVYLARPDAPETVVTIVKPGDTLEQIIHYQVSGVPDEGGLFLKERRSILHKETRLTDEVYERRQSAGNYRTALHITLPADAAPGEYVLEAGIIFGTQVVSRRFEFSIGGQDMN